MPKISIVDLEVFFCVGVTDEERAKPQRLLICIEMEFDFTSAAMNDHIEKTINYFNVAQEVLKYGEGRSWKLIEKTAGNIADMILQEFKPEEVTVEVKKFPISQARYVSVRLTRSKKRL